MAAMTHHYAADRQAASSFEGYNYQGCGGPQHHPHHPYDASNSSNNNSHTPVHYSHAPHVAGKGAHHPHHAMHEDDTAGRGYDVSRSLQGYTITDHPAMAAAHRSEAPLSGTHAQLSRRVDTTNTRELNHNACHNSHPPLRRSTLPPQPTSNPMVEHLEYDTPSVTYHQQRTNRHDGNTPSSHATDHTDAAAYLPDASSTSGLSAPRQLTENIPLCYYCGAKDHSYESCCHFNGAELAVVVDMCTVYFLSNRHWDRLTVGDIRRFVGHATGITSGVCLTYLGTQLHCDDAKCTQRLIGPGQVVFAYSPAFQEASSSNRPPAPSSRCQWCPKFMSRLAQEHGVLRDSGNMLKVAAETWMGIARGNNAIAESHHMADQRHMAAATAAKDEPPVVVAPVDDIRRDDSQEEASFPRDERQNATEGSVPAEGTNTVSLIPPKVHTPCADKSVAPVLQSPLGTVQVASKYPVPPTPPPAKWADLSIDLTPEGPVQKPALASMKATSEATKTSSSGDRPSALDAAVVESDGSESEFHQSESPTPTAARRPSCDSVRRTDATPRGNAVVDNDAEFLVPSALDMDEMKRRTVHLKDVPLHTTVGTLAAILLPHGEVHRLRLFRIRTERRKPLFAVVQFATIEGAQSFLSSCQLVVAQPKGMDRMLRIDDWKVRCGNSMQPIRDFVGCDGFDANGNVMCPSLHEDDDHSHSRRPSQADIVVLRDLNAYLVNSLHQTSRPDAAEQHTGAIQSVRQRFPCMLQIDSMRNLELSDVASRQGDVLQQRYLRQLSDLAEHGAAKQEAPQHLSKGSSMRSVESLKTEPAADWRDGQVEVRRGSTEVKFPLSYVETQMFSKGNQSVKTLRTPTFHDCVDADAMRSMLEDMKSRLRRFEKDGLRLLEHKLTRCCGLQLAMHLKANSTQKPDRPAAWRGKTDSLHRAVIDYGERSSADGHKGKLMPFPRFESYITMIAADIAIELHPVSRAHPNSCSARRLLLQELPSHVNMCLQRSFTVSPIFADDDLDALNYLLFRGRSDTGGAKATTADENTKAALQRLVDSAGAIQVTMKWPLLSSVIWLAALVEEVAPLLTQFLLRWVVHADETFSLGVLDGEAAGQVNRQAVWARKQLMTVIKEIVSENPMELLACSTNFLEAAQPSPRRGQAEAAVRSPKIIPLLSQYVATEEPRFIDGPMQISPLKVCEHRNAAEFILQTAFARGIFYL